MKRVHALAIASMVGLSSFTFAAPPADSKPPMDSKMPMEGKMSMDNKMPMDEKLAMQECEALQATLADASGRASYKEGAGVQFRKEDRVFVKSALAIEITDVYKATVTLPLYGGMAPNGKPTYYIITEASDFAVAKRLGVNFAPKMKHAAGTDGAQVVTLENGVMMFKGDVDFGPKYVVKAGPDEMPFPPKEFKPGAIANSEYSSIVVLPSGVVLNAQIVYNASGEHDRVKDVSKSKRTVTLSLLDGFQGGRQYYYHLVTDVSADLPAVLEKGVFAPRLAALPGVGMSMATDKSSLLGFSPVINGITDKKSGQHQGFAASLANDGIDPINVFPIEPDNDDASANNNYSPLWDAHVSEWTPEAIAANKVRRITSFEDLKKLIDEGSVTSASINPPGKGNPFLYGLRPTKAIINCPVIAHPMPAEKTAGAGE